MTRRHQWIVSFVVGVLLVVVPAWAVVVVFYDFEDGLIPNADINPPGPNLVPITVLTEGNGNHYLRLTASPSDCGPAFATTCPRTRAEVLIGWADVTIGETVTYRFRMRSPSSNPTSGQENLLWQLYQTDLNSNSGRSIWLGTHNNRLRVTNPDPAFYGGTAQVFDIGPIDYDVWHDYTIAVFLTDTPSLGRIDISGDGVFLGSLTGERTVLFNYLPTRVYLDVVDFNGVLGIVDFDNVLISTGGSEPKALCRRDHDEFQSCARAFLFLGDSLRPWRM